MNHDHVAAFMTPEIPQSEPSQADPPAPVPGERRTRGAARAMVPRAHAVIALTLALWLPGAQAVEAGVSPAGVAYTSGGVGEEELAALHAGRRDFSFWLTTAALGSGAYLADVQVRITQQTGGAPVLEHTMAGPWLFAALPPGRYRVEAAARAAPDKPLQVRRGQTTIHRGDRHQMVLYFDTGDERGSDGDAAPRR